MCSSLFYNFKGNLVNNAQLLVRCPPKQGVYTLDDLLWVYFVFQCCLLCKFGVLELTRGESVAKLPPAGSLLGLISAYHFLGEKYSPKLGDFTPSFWWCSSPIKDGCIPERNNGKMGYDMKKFLNLEGKPYTKCLNCQQRTEKQCGPRTSSMPLLAWCEYMRAMKEANHLTNLEIEKRSGVSIKTIEKLMALNCDQDIMRDTARRIEEAIMGSPAQFPCYLEFASNAPEASEKLSKALIDLERALNDNEDYRNAMNNVQAMHAVELQAIRDECDAKIAYLRAQLEREQRDNDNLWAEINRKSKMIDMLLEKQNALLTPQG